MAQIPVQSSPQARQSPYSAVQGAQASAPNLGRYKVDRGIFGRYQQAPQQNVQDRSPIGEALQSVGGSMQKIQNTLDIYEAKKQNAIDNGVAAAVKNRINQRQAKMSAELDLIDNVDDLKAYQENYKENFKRGLYDDIDIGSVSQEVAPSIQEYEANQMEMLGIDIGAKVDRKQLERMKAHHMEAYDLATQNGVTKEAEAQVNMMYDMGHINTEQKNKMIKAIGPKIQINESMSHARKIPAQELERLTARKEDGSYKHYGFSEELRDDAIKFAKQQLAEMQKITYQQVIGQINDGTDPDAILANAQAKRSFDQTKYDYAVKVLELYQKGEATESDLYQQEMIVSSMSRMSNGKQSALAADYTSKVKALLNPKEKSIEKDPDVKMVLDVINEDYKLGYLGATEFHHLGINLMGYDPTEEQSMALRKAKQDSIYRKSEAVEYIKQLKEQKPNISKTELLDAYKEWAGEPYRQQRENLILEVGNTYQNNTPLSLEDEQALKSAREKLSKLQQK